jgi:hypothetical protein
MKLKVRNAGGCKPQSVNSNVSVTIGNMWYDMMYIIHSFKKYMLSMTSSNKNNKCANKLPTKV